MSGHRPAAADSRARPSGTLVGREGRGPTWPRAGSPVFDRIDPREHEHAGWFFAYSVAPDELSVTIYARAGDGDEPVLYVSEEADAVHVVLVDRRLPTPPTGIYHGVGAEAEPVVVETVARLEHPLAGRPVIDAVRDQLAARVEVRPTPSDLPELTSPPAARRYVQEHCERIGVKAEEILAWSIDDTDRIVTAYATFPEALTLEAFETPTAVILLMTYEPRKAREGEHVGWALVGDPAPVSTRLLAPLAGRPVVEAAEGGVPRFVTVAPSNDSSSPNFIGLSAWEKADFAAGRALSLEMERAQHEPRADPA